MLGSKGFTTVLAALWTVVLTSFAVVIATILFVFGGWKLSELAWKKIRKKVGLKNA